MPDKSDAAARAAERIAALIPSDLAEYAASVRVYGPAIIREETAAERRELVQALRHSRHCADCAQQWDLCKHGRHAIELLAKHEGV